MRSLVVVRWLRLAAFLFAAVLAAGCGTDNPAHDGGVDAGPDGGSDAGVDAGPPQANLLFRLIGQAPGGFAIDPNSGADVNASDIGELVNETFNTAGVITASGFVGYASEQGEVGVRFNMPMVWGIPGDPGDYNSVVSDGWISGSPGIPSLAESLSSASTAGAIVYQVIPLPSGTYGPGYGQLTAGLSESDGGYAPSFQSQFSVAGQPIDGLAATTAQLADAGGYVVTAIWSAPLDDGGAGYAWYAARPSGANAAALDVTVSQSSFEELPGTVSSLAGAGYYLTASYYDGDGGLFTLVGARPPDAGTRTGLVAQEMAGAANGSGNDFAAQVSQGYSLVGAFYDPAHWDGGGEGYTVIYEK